MSQEVNRLSARTVQTLKAPGLHPDGEGLYLRIKETGAKSWVFIWKRNQKRREMGLGSTKTVTLAEARSQADEAQRQVARGLDPIEERKKRQIVGPTFGEFALDHIKAKQSEWKSVKHKAHWENSLRNHCPSIWNVRIREIGNQEIVDVLTPIWAEIPDMARRVRERIEDVLSAARVLGHRSGENPASWGGNLEHVLPRQRRLTRGHMAAMPYEIVPQFVAELAPIPAMSPKALEYLILNAARTVEVIGAKWKEIDFAAKIWTVPAERMKGMVAGKKLPREHRKPLSDRSIEILRFVGFLGMDPEGFIFPGAKENKGLSNMAMAETLKRHGRSEFTVHGFRTSFRDWVGDETEFPRELAEMSLAHAVGDETEQAYRRREAVERRRPIMEAWSHYLMGSDDIAGHTVSRE
jgi:integrase